MYSSFYVLQIEHEENLKINSLDNLQSKTQVLKATKANFVDLYKYVCTEEIMYGLNTAL